jgi:hypothetical protein
MLKCFKFQGVLNLKEQVGVAWGLGITMIITPMECAVYLKIAAKVGVSVPVLRCN